VRGRQECGRSGPHSGRSSPLSWRSAFPPVVWWPLLDESGCNLRLELVAELPQLLRRPRVLEDDAIDFERIQLAGTVAVNGFPDVGDQLSQLRVVVGRDHRTRCSSLRLVRHDHEATQAPAFVAAIADCDCAAPERGDWLPPSRHERMVRRTRHAACPLLASGDTCCPRTGRQRVRRSTLRHAAVIQPKSAAMAARWWSPARGASLWLPPKPALASTTFTAADTAVAAENAAQPRACPWRDAWAESSAAAGSPTKIGTAARLCFTDVAVAGVTWWGVPGG